MFITYEKPFIYEAFKAQFNNLQSLLESQNLLFIILCK